MPCSFVVPTRLQLLQRLLQLLWCRSQSRRNSKPQRVWDGNGWTEPAGTKDLEDARKGLFCDSEGEKDEYIIKRGPHSLSLCLCVEKNSGQWKEMPGFLLGMWWYVFSFFS